MDKPTPGPWNWACDSYGKVQHSKKYDCVFTTVKGQGGDRLATIAARIENPANARLIAAAPELMSLAEFILRPEHASLDAETLIAEYESMARAAIAKAKGESNG